MSILILENYVRVWGCGVHAYNPAWSAVARCSASSSKPQMT